MKAHRSAVSRFASAPIETDRSMGLRSDHPALSEARTIFPTTVVASKASPRFLISGHNNPKLGKEVLKGPRTGWPIYQLSLEERATCPTTCAVWADCYGNAMPYARRHKPDADFERYLEAEVITLARAHPDGLLIRLHALGDFYSPAYVMLWARMLAEFPQLHVFGYTARQVEDADPDSAKTARAIHLLTEAIWERFAIRTSGVSAARSRSIVVDQNPERPNVIVCPAQTTDTEACATCGLCWASAARDKTIAFLRHGMKRRAAADRAPVARSVQPGANAVAAPKTKPAFASGRVNKSEQARQLVEAALAKLAPTMPGGLSAKDIYEETGLKYEQIVTACGYLSRAGRARWTYARGKGSKVLLPANASSAAMPVTFSENQHNALMVMRMATVRQAKADYDGTFSMMRSEIASSAGIPSGSIGEVIDSLVRKGAVEIVAQGTPHTATNFRLIGSKAIPAADLPLLAEALKQMAETMPIQRLDAPKPPLTAMPAPAPDIPITTKVTLVPAPRPKAENDDAPLAGAKPRTLGARKPGQCAWPLDDPGQGRMEQTTYCCAPVAGKLQYCADHCRAMWPKAKVAA